MARLLFFFLWIVFSFPQIFYNIISIVVVFSFDGFFFVQYFQFLLWYGYPINLSELQLVLMSPLIVIRKHIRSEYNKIVLLMFKSATLAAHWGNKRFVSICCMLHVSDNFLPFQSGNMIVWHFLNVL